MSWRNELTVGLLRAERIFFGTDNGGLGTELSTAELGYLDGVTPGTVEAEKAVVVDSDKDIDGFRNINITGTFTVNGTTMEGTEFAVIDGVTPGVAAAGKAIVLDGSADLLSGINDFNIDGNLVVKGGGIVGGVDQSAAGTLTLYHSDSGPMQEFNVVGDDGSESWHVKVGTGVYFELFDGSGPAKITIPSAVAAGLEIATALVVGTTLTIGDTTYGDGSIVDTGAYQITVAADSVFTLRDADGDWLFAAYSNGACQLYNNNQMKLNTKSTGIDVTGRIDATSTISNGTLSMIGDAIESTGSFTVQLGGGEVGMVLTQNGGATLYYDNSQGFSVHSAGVYIYDTSGRQANLYFNSTELRLANLVAGGALTLQVKETGGEGVVYDAIKCDNDVGTIIYHVNGSQKFATKSDGVDITGEMSATTIEIGGTPVSASAAELNLNDNQPASVSFDTLTGGVGTITLAATVKDAAGTAMANATALHIYVSSVATGIGYSAPTTITETNGVVAGAAGSLEIYHCTTDATGQLDCTINIGAGTYYVVFVMPNGSLQISGSVVVT